jgi:hypothetical protein
LKTASIVMLMIFMQPPGCGSSVGHHAGQAGAPRLLAVQPAADLVGGGLVELVEDGPGLPPGVAGRAEVAGVAVQLAEAGQAAGLALAVAELPEQRQGPPVAVDRLGPVAEPVVGVAKA